MTQTSWNGTQDDNCSSSQCHVITDAGLPRVSCKEEEVTLPEAQVAALSLLPRGSLPTPQPSQAQPPLPTDLRAYRAPHDPKTSPLHTPSAYLTLLKEQTNQATTWRSSSERGQLGHVTTAQHAPHTRNSLREGCARDFSRWNFCECNKLKPHNESETDSAYLLLRALSFHS